MGIGGAVLYSLAYMAVRGLVNVSTLVTRSLRSAALALFDGGALHGGEPHGWRRQRQVDEGATGD